jgi:hypothetical protein
MLFSVAWPSALHFYAAPTGNDFDSLYLGADLLIEDDVTEIEEATPASVQMGVPIRGAVYGTLLLIHGG